MSEYRVIPGPMAIKSAGAKALERAAGAYQELIARETAGGWEFVCFDSTTVHTAVCGCLSKQVIEVKLLVFRR